MPATPENESLEPKIRDPRTYIAFTLDPVHVGTGEFQLGRVDNTIVREPGTNLPKIPGSSIAGVTRACADLLKRAKSENGTTSCAGKGGAGGDEHCGKATCPACMAFGFSKGKEKQSFQGLVQFSDARLLFFPVYSLLGPVWLTSPSALADAEIDFGLDASAAHSALYDSGTHHVWLCPELKKEAGAAGRMNMGWLYLPVFQKGDLIQPPDDWKWKLGDKPAVGPDLPPILSRIAIVDDLLFPIIVEDQLEVRTSVSINPGTGAAEGGALFTAEAIPRGAVLTFQVTAVNPRFFTHPGGGAIDSSLDLHTTAYDAMKLIGSLGLGGSNTRGNGRIRITEAGGN